MKRIFLTIFTLLSAIASAQIDGIPYLFCALNGEQYNPGTHNNVEGNDWVVTKSDEDYTRYEKAFISERFNDDYSNHTIIGEPTVSYNCHGYSFGIYQGTIPCKITWFDELCDSAFIRITNTDSLKFGDIAVIRYKVGEGYDPGSIHSSIVINQDTLISKWGDGPLTKHYKYDLTSDIYYFDDSLHGVYTYYRRVANTQINGADVFNGNGTYTFAPDVEIESCTWNVEPAAMFQQSSGSGTIANLSYKPNLSYLAPKAVLTFTFGYSCDNHYTVKKEIDLTVPTMSVSGEMTCDGFAIRENSTVTVTGRIKINENGKVIIKPGGKLVIDGGELTSVCSDKQWQGIEVWGVDSLNQNMVNGLSQQGCLVLKNGATIENAICAVNLCNPSDEHGSGGVVQATDAVFRNNGKSIRATDYSNYGQNPNVEIANASFFRQCSFTVDEDYIGDETFYSHVELSEVDGIRFYACSFSVDNDVSQVSSSSSAITAYNAAFSVEALCDSQAFPCPESAKIRSTFDGFNKAVSITNSGGVSRTFSINSSSFNNNEIGIYAENTGYATIIMNDFMVGTKGSCNYGIYLDHVTNFCIEENTFSRDNYVITMNKIYGIAVKNSASFNDIYLNHFSNLYCGVVAIGSNRIPGLPNLDLGLTYTCNTNYGNTNDIGVLREGVYGNIDGEQGSNSVGAGNTFGASNYHFYHNGINHSKVKYYYHGSGDKIPTRRYNVTIESATSDNDCHSHYSAIPPGPGGELMSVITTDSLGSRYTLTRVTGNLVRNSLNEEERDYDELREWLGKANDINSDRMIVASYIHQGDFDNASSYAKTLVKKYALQGAELDEHLDYMEIISLHESLYETQRSVKQLTDYETAMLEDIAENGVGGSQLMARSILDESRGTPTIIISSCPTIPTYGASVRGKSEEITEPTSDNGLKVEVSPNPATSSVEISYVLPEKEKTATFVLTSTLGVNVFTTELGGNKGVATVNLDDIPSGIYFYTVRSGDDVITGKLVVE